MGNPTYKNPHSIPPGHIVALSWDSSLYKFGIDRFAEIRNDYGKADIFHFRIPLADAAKAWAGQKLTDGLPLITSIFEEEGVRYEIEQFASPLLGPPAERRGDIAMVMLQKVTLREMEGKARPYQSGCSSGVSCRAPSRCVKKTARFCSETGRPLGSQYRARALR